MATKREKRSGAKTARRTAKAKKRSAGAGVTERRRTPDRREPERRLTPDRRPALAVPAIAEPSLLERAEQLRAAIERSKLTAPDPWTYTARARRWGQRAQQLVEQIAREGDTAALRRRLEALTAELEADRDFQEARRLF